MISSWARSCRAFTACFFGLLLVLGGAVPGFSFALNGFRWPDGTQIAMHLQLTHASGALQDGSASWNGSAADALSIWNQYVDTVQFAAAEPSGSSGSDGANEVLFSGTVYGDNWGANVLAVTLKMSSQGSVFTETDVLFNDKLKWNSYRGPLQGSGPTGTFDFHRVALHEFGHVLGLDHPDQHGQIVVAQMNSTIGDLDHLADDDIAGARSLYGKAKLTAYLGANFSYQVGSSNTSATYSASGLPPGLTINSSSGLISGVPNLSGTYSVVVNVTGPSGSASLPLQIVVTAPSAATLGMLQKLDISVNRLVADPKRARVYATVPASNSVAVIDTVSLAIIKTIPIGSNPVGLAISADGTRLWVANSGSNIAGIGVIDLNSLTTLPSIALPNAPSDVEEGLDNRLYATPATPQTDGLMQVNTVTGETRTFGSFEIRYADFLEISPDRKTLYVGDHNVSPATACRFDVSTAVPTLLQQARFNGGSGVDLKLSHNGLMLVFPSGGGNGQGYSTYEIPAANLTGVLGTFTPGSYPGPAAFSGDDSLLYHSSQAQSKIAIFDTRTFVLTGAINLGTVPGTSNGSYDARDLVLDNTGSKLFIATTFYFQNGDVRIYETGRTNTAPLVAKSLANVSTRMSVEPGDDALIGGFIIQGSDSKTVVVRAIGPSLPVNGKLLDPKLQIYDSAGGIIASNDNWNSDRSHVLTTGLAPKDEHEAAVIVSLAPGAYTAVVSGVGDTAGVGLVELYDIDSNHSRMANIATRGSVQAADNVMIGGFIIAGDQPTKIIVRAIGPSLGASGVANPLPDPVLELHDGNGSLITENDDWRSLQEDAIKSTGIPPGDDRESAIVATLQPGNYTAIVRGKDERTGVGLVEIYNLDAN